MDTMEPSCKPGDHEEKDFTPRNLDVAVEASIDMVSLNNKIVKMRSVVRRVKVQLINKMTRHINMLKKKRGSDEQKKKNLNKGQHLLDEIQAMKHLSLDKVSKYAMSSSLTFADVCKRATVSDELRALSRMSEHKLLRDIVNQFREEHPDWQSLTAYLLMNPGRRFKKKRRGKPKDKTSVNIKAGKDLVKVYLGEKFDGDEKVVVTQKLNEKVTSGKKSNDESESNDEFTDKVSHGSIGINDDKKLGEKEKDIRNDDDDDDDDDDEIDHDDNDSSDELEEEKDDDDDGDDGDDNDDDKDDDDDDKDDDDDDDDSSFLVKDDFLKRGRLSDEIDESVSTKERTKVKNVKSLDAKSIKKVKKDSPLKKQEFSLSQKIQISDSGRTEMVVKKLNLDEIPDEFSVSVTLDEMSSKTASDEKIKTKQKHKDSFFVSSVVDENSDEEESSDNYISDDSKSDFDEDNEQLFRGGRVMHSTFIGSLSDDKVALHRNRTRGGYNQNANSRGRGGNRGRFEKGSTNYNNRKEYKRHETFRGKFERKGSNFTRPDNINNNNRRDYKGKFERRGSNFTRPDNINRRSYPSKGGFDSKDDSNSNFKHNRWNNRNTQSSEDKNRDKPVKENFKSTDWKLKKSGSDNTMESQEKLHPSWQASKKRKEQAQIQVFTGKKIKFDDD